MSVSRFALVAALAATITTGGLMLSGCSQQESSEASATTRPAANEVVWPDLRELDNLVHKIDALTAANQMDEARAHIPELVEKATTVANSNLPEDAHNIEEAQLRQTELKSLVDSLSAASEATDEELKPILDAFHPVVIMLGQRVGMPHKHEAHDGHDHDHDHDHDHSDHDHDHDHDHADGEDHSDHNH